MSGERRSLRPDDFTEARFAVKIDRSKNLLRSFIDLNNAALEHFSDAELDRIGVYTGPGAQAGFSLGVDVDNAELLPDCSNRRYAGFISRWPEKRTAPEP